MKTIPYFESYQDILTYLDTIDLKKYGQTRNFTNGAVTALSAYISRGVISVYDIIMYLKQQNKLNFYAERFVQQLLWREFFYQQWQQQDDLSFNDLQDDLNSFESKYLSKAIQNASTGITAIDEHITHLKQTGYMHNHMRMYVAALACNVAKSHWREPALWMYFYLYDGDWASNALSWQWVAGVRRNRRYIMNQDNINKYTAIEQKNSFLDCNYEQLPPKKIPDILANYQQHMRQCALNNICSDSLNNPEHIALYTSYTLNPLWQAHPQAYPVLLLEPQHFQQYPVSEQVLVFICNLAKRFIKNIRIVVANFNDFKKHYPHSKLYVIDHPFTRHFSAQKTQLNHFEPLKKCYTQYFAYYKAIKKQVF